MDDDLGGGGGIEVTLSHGGDVVVFQNLWYLLVVLGVQVEHCPDLLRGGGQHVQVVEWSFISEAAKVSITNYFFISFLSTEVYLLARNPDS